MSRKVSIKAIILYCTFSVSTHSNFKTETNSKIYSVQPPKLHLPLLDDDLIVSSQDWISGGPELASDSELEAEGRVSCSTDVQMYRCTEEGRVSAQSLSSDSKPVTPPGDEVWAQKCHELDFQVSHVSHVSDHYQNQWSVHPSWCDL